MRNGAATYNWINSFQYHLYSEHGDLKLRVLRPPTRLWKVKNIATKRTGESDNTIN